MHGLLSGCVVSYRLLLFVFYIKITDIVLMLMQS